MKTKKGFSFLELLIVMMIISILFVTFKSSFQIKNKDILYGQACIEHVYGEVNNFVYAAISSKSVYSWDIQIFPHTYIVSFKPVEQTIDLWYQVSWEQYTLYTTISLSGNNHYCSSNSYSILLSWMTYDIYIHKGLQWGPNMRFFYLSGAGVSTGENMFLQCDTQWTWCTDIALFRSDTRTISIYKQICLSVSTSGNCNEWDN